MALASCSKDETTSINTGEGIAFRSAMGTRATETTITNLNSFNVTALTEDGSYYFKDALFENDGMGGASFVSDPSYYWPATGTLSFYAYAPSSLSANVSISSTTKTVAVTPDTEIAKQVDFITATATGDKENNEGTGVELTFEHRLAQISVMAKNSNTNYVYKIKGVKIGQFIDGGTFDFATTNWTLGSNKTDYMIKYDTEHTLAATAVNIMDATGSSDNGTAMLIPQQLTAWDAATDATNANAGAYLSVLVNITTKDGAQIYPAAEGAYGWAAAGIATNLEAGKKYVYTLDFSNGAGNIDPEGPDGGDPNPDPDPDPDDELNPGEDIFGEPITFEVTVSAWTESDQEVTLQ